MHKCLHVGGRMVMWPVRANWPFDFFSLYTAPATLGLSETVFTNSGNIVCDSERKATFSSF